VAETVLTHAPCAALVIPPLRLYSMAEDEMYASLGRAIPAGSA
jgi:hypothetical protein